MAEGMEKIEHLIVLTMENRSFDHYLGSLTLEGRTDVDGLSEPLPSLLDLEGCRIEAWKMDRIPYGFPDLPHGWEVQHTNWNGGLNDGFVRQYQREYRGGESPGFSPDVPLGYYTRAALPVLYTLADQFSVCDHWFSSVLSSTWPNRKYMLSGRRDQERDTETLPVAPGFKTTPFCAALGDSRDPATGRRLTWKNYFTDLPYLGCWYPFALAHALTHFATIEHFVHDCREECLPTVSLIDPAICLADDHPTHDIRLGQKFIGLVVDALTHSQSWAKSALVVLYDEAGGFYDHVPPPPSFEAQAGIVPPLDDPLGFRVPALVISPYPRSGRACHTVFDHTSVMKSIHIRWEVPFDPKEYGCRWQHAPDIWTDCFDFNQAPLPIGSYTQPAADVAAGKPPPFADLRWSDAALALVDQPTGRMQRLLTQIFGLADLKALDRRAQALDSLWAMELHSAALKERR